MNFLNEHFEAMNLVLPAIEQTLRNHYYLMSTVATALQQCNGHLMSNSILNFTILSLQLSVAMIQLNIQMTED